MLSILPKHKYPKILRHPAVKGICYNGCIWELETPYTSPFIERNDLAHAHRSDDPCANWLCFRSINNLYDRETQAHELAHLITSCDGHRADWFDAMIDLANYFKFNETIMEQVRRDVVYCFLERSDG